MLAQLTSENLTNKRQNSDITVSSSHFIEQNKSSSTIKRQAALSTIKRLLVAEPDQDTHSRELTMMWYIYTITD